jgi:Zn finger protein HypA/HybF involved in hydrogenase expression
MKWKCLKCKREEFGPLAARRICPVCHEDMVPIATVEEADGTKTEKALKRLEE